jgi:NitT/TauT family transport system permease protein
MAILGTDRRRDRIDAELEGLDQLEMAVAPRPSRARRIWAASWPKLLAVAIFLFVWQALVWTGWRSETILKSPPTVFKALWDDRTTLLESTGNTLKMGAQGYALALLIGVVVGAAVARNRILRAGIGSMITGLQTMPSIAWFPIAIVLFGRDESAIFFVVVMGAAPSIANGLINGIDHIPPILLRAGRVLGARRLTAFRHVIMPASLPAFVGGLKQGWAFAWRSLMAGELLNVIPGSKSLGQQLDVNRQLVDYAGVLAVMVVIFVIGVVIDAVFFGNIERWIRRRYGLVDEATAA